MAHRGRDTGSIEQRAPTKFRLRWTSPPDPLTGERRRRSEIFHGTKTAASKRLAELTSGTRPSASTPLALALERWRGDARHENATAKNYDRAAATPGVDLIAKTPMNEVTADQIRALIKATNAAFGISRARLVHAYLSGGLTYAWRHQWITDNPARRVAIPPQPVRAPSEPTPSELAAALALVESDEQFDAWLRTSSDVGSRPAETLALRWVDVDLDAATARVAVALDPIDGHLKDIKNHQRRTVALDVDTVASLRRWRAASRRRALAVGVHLADDAYVFSLAPDSLTPWRRDYGTRHWAKIRKAAGIRDVIRLYDLRHYVGSNMTASGVDPKTTAGRLGHKRVATTTDVYSHVQRPVDAAAAVTLGDKLRVASGKKPIAKRRRLVVRRSS